MDMKKTILATLAILGMSCALAAVNITTACTEELKALPGIGVAQAYAIVETSKRHGDFRRF